MFNSPRRGTEEASNSPRRFSLTSSLLNDESTGSTFMAEVARDLDNGWKYEVRIGRSSLTLSYQKKCYGKPNFVSGIYVDLINKIPQFLRAMFRLQGASLTQLRHRVFWEELP